MLKNAIQVLTQSQTLFFFGVVAWKIRLEFEVKKKLATRRGEI